MVVADGRSASSSGINVQTLAEYMLSKGCKHAFNLDGGGSSYMFYRNGIYNLTTGKHRNLYDIIYFASADYDG